MKRKHILLALGWYHPKTHQGIAQFAGENNWHLASEMAFNQNLPWDWQGDGVIASLVAGRGYEDFIATNPAPAVIIGNSSHGLDTVLIHEDNRAIANMAAEYFIERGFQHYAFFWTQPHHRGILFKERLAEEGFSCTTLLPSVQDSHCSSLFEWLIEQLSCLPKPVAIFCPDDNSGAEVIEACIDCGISVPEEVAVLGVHNDEIVCENLPVTLSSIDNNFIGQGYEAAKILQQLMNGDDVPPQTILVPPTGVVERLSSDILAYDNVELTKALRFIKNNFHKYIGVEDVVDVTEVSRRNLYSIFKRFINRTIAEEILRCRMDAAKKLLSESDIAVTKVATIVGFQDYRIFHRNFRKQENCTPTAWRQRVNKITG